MQARLLFALLTTVYSLAPAHAQRTIIWQPDTTLRANTSAPFDRVRIADLRHDTTATIGSLRTGMRARHSNLVTDGPVSDVLAAYAIQLLLGSQTTPGELLVVLRDFRVEDYDGVDEIGTVYLRVDLFRSASTSDQYLHLRSVDTLRETKSHGDVTKGVQGLTSEVFLEMMTAGASAAPSQTTHYTFAAACSRADMVKNAWPLYADSTPPRGIYHSLDDVFHLRTTDTAFTDLKVLSPDGPPTWYFYRKNSRGKKGEAIRPKDCFAIYDGKQWLISNTVRFERFKQENGDFYTSVLLNGLVADRSAWITVNGLPVARIPLGDPGLKPTSYRVRLDTEAGRFVPVRRNQ